MRCCISVGVEKNIIMYPGCLFHDSSTPRVMHGIAQRTMVLHLTHRQATNAVDRPGVFGEANSKLAVKFESGHRSGQAHAYNRWPKGPCKTRD